MTRKLIVEIPRVFVFLPSSVKTYREILTGILNYAHLYGPWSVRIFQDRPDEYDRLDLDPREADAMIGWVPQKLLSMVRPDCAVLPLDDGDCPAGVKTRSRRRSIVHCENGRIGEEAARYFLERGFVHFAFFGDLRAKWSQERGVAFTHVVREAGFRCVHLPGRVTATAISRLEKPVAVFAANDVRGRQLCDLCLREGISVPREVAVLSCDNDALLCETSVPPLSSVQLDTVEAGYAAARALHAMMRGCRKVGDVTYGFSHVVARASTDTLNIDDDIAERARELISLNWQDGFSIAQLAQRMRVSRRLLERRFRNATGRSLHDELVRVRIERAKELLKKRDVPVSEIAEACGFSSASHFGEVFRRMSKLSPVQYRRKIGGLT